MVRKMFTAVFITLAMGTQAHAQELLADVASYVTLGVNVALDTKASWDSPDRQRALIMQGVRLGVTAGAVTLIKHYFPTARPCAPTCGIDSPFSDVPSGHMAFATQALGGPRFAIGIPLAVTTGGLRMAANKHDLLGVAVGAGVGMLASRIR